MRRLIDEDERTIATVFPVRIGVDWTIQRQTYAGEIVARKAIHCLM